jgi:hypothetical protein
MPDVHIEQGQCVLPPYLFWWQLGLSGKILQGHIVGPHHHIFGGYVMEANGVGTQDEHFVPSPNWWANRKGQLGDPTIPKELCGSGLTRLGGPFGVCF